jgi:DNA-binding NarL/FixJ family response regulator
MSNRHVTGEGDMIAAMFAQSFEDGCAPLTDSLHEYRNGAKRARAGRKATMQEALHEWRFLTALAGEWADSRKLWAGLAGMDEHIIREEALRRGPSNMAQRGMAWVREAKAREAEKAAEAATKAAVKAAAQAAKAEAKLKPPKPPKPRLEPRPRVENLSSRQWTAEEDAEALRLDAEGLTHRQIGNAIGRSRAGVKTRLGLLRTPRMPNAKWWTEEEEAAIAAGRAAGKTTQEIADQIGRSLRAVRLRINQSDIPRFNAGRRKAA